MTEGDFMAAAGGAVVLLYIAICVWMHLEGKRGL